MRTLCLFLALLTAMPIAAQSPPDLINYQGTLLAGNGTPEPGPKTLEFRIVDEGSAVVWGPQTFEELPLQHGKFNVLLGQADNDGPFVSTAFAGDGDAARYLSVKVAGEPTEKLPLQRIASVPFALKAEDAGGLGGIGAEEFPTRSELRTVLHRSPAYSNSFVNASVPTQTEILRTPAFVATDRPVRVETGAGSGSPSGVGLSESNNAAAVDQVAFFLYRHSGSTETLVYRTHLHCNENTGEKTGIRWPPNVVSFSDDGVSPGESTEYILKITYLCNSVGELHIENLQLVAYEMP